MCQKGNGQIIYEIVCLRLTMSDAVTQACNNLPDTALSKSGIFCILFWTGLLRDWSSENLNHHRQKSVETLRSTSNLRLSSESNLAGELHGFGLQSNFAIGNDAYFFWGDDLLMTE